MADPTLFQPQSIVNPLIAMPPGKFAGAYAIVNRIDGRRYVGGSIDVRRRWQYHERDLRKHQHDCKRLQRAWDRCSASDFEWVVLEICDVEHVWQCEQKWLDHYTPFIAKNGYNSSWTADGASGWHHSEATKEKMRGHPSTTSDKQREVTRQRNIGNTYGKNRHFRGILHPEDIRIILDRAAAGESTASLAEFYGVGFNAINNIRKRSAWWSVKVSPHIAELAAMQSVAKGEQNGFSKLTEEQVREILIKSAAGEKCQPLADEYGVKRITISKIRQRKLWKHLNVPEYKNPRRSPRS